MKSAPAKHNIKSNKLASQGFYNYYNELALNNNERNKILQKLPMNQSINIWAAIGKVSLGLMSLAVFSMGVLAMAPYKAMDYVPNKALKYVPTKIQEKYVDQTQNELSNVDNMLNEIDQLQNELNNLDADLSSVSN